MKKNSLVWQESVRSRIRAPISAMVRSFKEIKKQMTQLERQLNSLEKSLVEYRKRYYSRQVG